MAKQKSHTMMVDRSREGQPVRSRVRTNKVFETCVERLQYNGYSQNALI